MRIVIILAFLILSNLCIHAQEAIGLSFGSNNGLTSATINPSFISRYPYKWELQLGGAHLFAQTNYGFVNNSSLINVIRDRDNIQIAQSDIPFSEYQRPLVFRSDQAQFRFRGKAEVYAPGFMINFGDQTIGASVKGRVYGSAQDIPGVFSYQNLADLPVDSNFVVNAFDVNAASWSEFALHYAVDAGQGITYGVNLKYLKAYQAAALNSNPEFQFSQDVNQVISSLENGQINYAYTSGENLNQSNGTGFGLDLGITSSTIFPFKSQVGLSILDLGWINYSGNNYNLSFSDSSIDFANYENISTDEALIAQLTDDFVNIDSSQSFRMYLPTALSLQILKPLNNHWHIEGSLTQAIKFNSRQITRANSVNASLIYNRKHFSAYMPLSIYNYESIRLGAAVRFYFLTIGSDHLSSVISNNQDFEGSDIYINIKIYPFSRARNADSKKGVNCYYGS